MKYESSEPQLLLTPGHALFLTGGQPTIRLPHGELIAVNLGTLGLNTQDYHSTSAAGSDTVVLEKLLRMPAFGQAMAQRGFAGYKSGTSWSAQRRRIGLGGSGQIADGLAALLKRAGCELVRVVDPKEAQALDVSALCWCSDDVAPQLWLDQEHLLIGAGIAWLRVSVEGALAYLEPLAFGPLAVDHRAVRSRRLAASAHPDAQLSLWHGDGISEPYLMSAAAGGLVADLLFNDLRDWATSRPGETVEASQRLRVVDLRELISQDHPILVIPPAQRRDR
ncbi:hypothetical protein EH165_13275 [Nakamurella antarctica]|uniref:Uncharacterized protein n=1 Tax=Nakamurella antarctica TaxID=1902245 RepID=A0A3G8ZZJ4_9ACTN|nr:hypothetical protein [Nakamurella antarctica]AZI58971.1 hypothetical protein EH165_13275 [Nakamurella antarctica]